MAFDRADIFQVFLQKEALGPVEKEKVKRQVKEASVSAENFFRGDLVSEKNK